MAARKKPSTELSTSVEQQLAQRVQTAMANTEPDTSNIIRPDLQGFQYQGATLGMEFHAIVLGAVYENTYYDRPYEKDAGVVMPLCWALGDNQRDIAPLADLVTRQAPSCAECEFNEFGTALQGKGKACRNGMRIAVVAVGDPEDMSTCDPTEVAVLRISPTAIKVFNGYARKVYRANRDLLQVVTKFGIDRGSTYPKIADPEPVASVNDATLIQRLLAIDVRSVLYDVPYILDPEPYVAPKRTPTKRRSRLS